VGSEVREHCLLDAAGKSLLRAAMTQLGTHARAFHRTAKRQAGAYDC
jgi:predicted ATPase with chaperone activity